MSYMSSRLASAALKVTHQKVSHLELTLNITLLRPL